MKIKIQNRNLANQSVLFPFSGHVKADAEGTFEVEVDDARAFHASPGFRLAPGETLPEPDVAAPAPTRKPVRAAGGEGGSKGRKASRRAAQEPVEGDDGDGEGDDGDAEGEAQGAATAMPQGEPSMAWTEEQIRTWLRAHDCEPDPDWTKPRLLAEVTNTQEA